MRIAQVSPLEESVPPQRYGGVELIVSHLCEGLIRRSHQVTLFASGDSQTSAELVSASPIALRLNPHLKKDPYQALQLSQVLERSHQFDLIHFHTNYLTLPFGECLQTPFLHTLHYGYAGGSEQLYKRHHHQCFISISQAQRQHLPQLNYVSTVYNGIDINKYPFQPDPQQPPYLAFLGRLSPLKGTKEAIIVAKQAGWLLKMAGKVDQGDRDYFEQELVPHIDGEQIQYLGEVSNAQKVDLLANASATLFPIAWNEPFGLVMLESMCVGTPVVALNKGSVPEVIADGQTGRVCNSIEEMVSAIPEAVYLDRKLCREYVVNRFGIEKMLDGYEAAYAQVLNRHGWKKSREARSRQFC